MRCAASAGVAATVRPKSSAAVKFLQLVMIILHHCAVRPMPFRLCRPAHQKPPRRTIVASGFPNGDVAVHTAHCSCHDTGVNVGTSDLVRAAAPAACSCPP